MIQNQSFAQHSHMPSKKKDKINSEKPNRTFIRHTFLMMISFVKGGKTSKPTCEKLSGNHMHEVKRNSKKLKDIGQYVKKHLTRTCTHVCSWNTLQ